MAEQSKQQTAEDAALGELARAVLIDLYRALSGHTPQSVRVYGEDDALLLLLRFDPDELAGADDIGFEPLTDTTFIALPSMIASAVQRRARRTLFPGNLSVCADRGLAVFAFSALDAAGSEEIGAVAPFATRNAAWSSRAMSLS